MTTYPPPTYPTDNLPTARCIPEIHAAENGCYHCCSQCNYDRHNCAFCGEPITHDNRSQDIAYHECYIDFEAIAAMTKEQLDMSMERCDADLYMVTWYQNTWEQCQ